MATAKKETTAKTTSTGFVPKVKRALVLPLLKKQDDVPIYIKITGAINTSESGAQKAGDGKDMEPARVCNCDNLETGEQCQIIVNTVLESTLQRNFPDDSYVGCGFEIIQHKTPGKRYKTYTVNELGL